MKKLIDYLMIFAALIFLGVGCQSEEISPIGEDELNISEVRTFSLTASMPEESGSTRIAFTQEGKSVALTWEVGDQLDLLFVQGETRVKQDSVTVSNISPDGKKAYFAIILPDAIQSGTFDLYGVYGGGGLSDSIPSLAMLPMITGSAPSLESLAEGEHFMIVFSKTELSTSSPQASVTFRHLGSLFCLTLKNASGTALENLGSARLVSSGSGWAYNSGTEQRFYNLVDSAFLETGTAGSFITLYGDGGVATNDTLNFWGWYPTLPDVTWPELTLKLYDKSNALLGESGNVKWARTSQPGNCYHLYAVKNDAGAGLHFTDHTYTGVFDVEGNYYSTVVIGTQEWMAENLKTTKYNDGTPIPNVTDNTEWSGLTTGAYAWYANDEATYKNAYGALYNWYAVNTGKLCPTGWHVPTHAEWETLVNYAGGVSFAGGRLKSTRMAPDVHPRWDSSDAVATDEYGFSALPGGARHCSVGSFYFMGKFGYWWSSTEYDASDAWYSSMEYDKVSVILYNFDKKGGYSVRCLRGGSGSSDDVPDFGGQDW